MKEIRQVVIRVNKLSKEQFEKAKIYLKTKAQDMDLAMFEYFFEGKPLSEVIKVLETYQNGDGGFGKLDYDFEYPYSCLKHTESACRYIYALGQIPVDHPMIQRLMQYIINNYNQVTGEWDNLLVPEVNNYPHAFWWEYKKSKIFVPKDREALINHYNPNINSSLAGMLVKYSSIVPKGMLETVKEIVVGKINSGYQFSQYGMMSDTYFVSALADREVKNQLLNRLMGNGKLISLLDAEWSTENAYKLCHWIDSPDHPYYLGYKKDVDRNLQFLINCQGEDGSWSPSWSWGDDEVWGRVSKRLKGVLTYKFLTTLKRFDSIEE